jgi:hypothetical protein
VGSPSGNLVSALCAKSEPDLHELAFAARRLIAAECCAFLKRAGSEHCEVGALRRWLMNLGPEHSIITFNYDTVVETVARAVNRDVSTFLPGSKFPPGARAPVQAARQRELGVRWAHVPSSGSRRVRPYLPCRADGYREPEADEAGHRGAPKRTLEARRRCHQGRRRCRLHRLPLPALRRVFTATVVPGLVANRQPFLALHTVLGPHTSDPATMRIRSLLPHAAQQSEREEATQRGWYYPNVQGRHYTLDVHPLWGEDFMDVFVAAHVFQAWRFPRASSACCRC